MNLLNQETAKINTTYAERIVQFGGGNFLRAFADWMIDILNEEAGFDSSAVVVKPTPRGSYETLDKQDGLFNVRLHDVQDGNLKTSKRLISCISRSLNPYTHYNDYLALARQPELRFVLSNTTESGIAFEASDAFDDASASSFPAKLTRFLFERFQQFDGASDKGLIMLPCELIEDNAHTLRSIILQYAYQWSLGDKFKSWISQHNDFYNTLVDRIVIGHPETAEDVWQDLGYKDELLVDGEAYHSWIIEAPQNLQDELPFDKTKLNVQLSDDLNIQRDIKVRILNGAHTAMVPVGYLAGERSVDGVMANPNLESFVQDLLLKEVIPSFEIETNELKPFASATLHRFRNPVLKHQLSAIALNATSKFKTRLLPSLLSYTKKQTHPPKRIVFALACLSYFYKGSWQGETTPVQDDASITKKWLDLWENSKSMQELSQNVLATSEFWEEDLSNISGLSALLANYLSSLEHNQLTETLKALKEDHD